MSSEDRLGPRSTSRGIPTNPLKIVGLTFLFTALLSVDFGALALSSVATNAPLQLILVAFIDTALLSYFVISSRWTGRKEWGAVFALLYGMVYVLTAVESVYLGSLLSEATVAGLLSNGAITSGIFAAALVWAFGGRGIQADHPANLRLHMPKKEWAWKILASSGVYLFLFIIFGLVVYAPLGKTLDPSAYAQEQSMAANAATLVVPIELLRGALWAMLAVPAIIALRFDWKKTGLVVGLLMATPLALTQYLATSIPFGLQLAHSGEIFGENLVFGLVLVWILKTHSRLPTGTAETVKLWAHADPEKGVQRGLVSGTPVARQGRSIRRLEPQNTGHKIPDRFLDLVDCPRVAALTTVMPDGSPHTTVVWCNYDGVNVLVNTMRGFRKEKNMRLNPRVTLLCYDPSQPLRSLEVRGRVVEMTEDGAMGHLDELTEMYIGKKPYFGKCVPVKLKEKEKPVLCKIFPTHVITLDARPQEVIAR